MSAAGGASSRPAPLCVLSTSTAGRRRIPNATPRFRTPDRLFFVDFRPAPIEQRALHSYTPPKHRGLPPGVRFATRGAAVTARIRVEHSSEGVVRADVLEEGFLDLIACE